MLELAEHSTEMAAALTTQLLAYAGKGKFVIARFDFSALVTEMLPLIAASVPKAVQLQISLAQLVATTHASLVEWGRM